MRALACLGTSLVLVSAIGCAPTIDSGCNADLDCDRGQQCELESAECIDLGLAVDATETPTPEMFDDKTIPFFRGRVCTVHSVKAGSAFPVFLDPCVHSCLTVSSFNFKHSWNCVGSRCSAWGTVWVNASGAGCPGDAFGRFDRSQCVTIDDPVEFTITAQFGDGQPIEGQMRLEIPFLTNADIADASALSGQAQTDRIEELLHKYPEDPSRVPGGMNISLLDSNPEPPATCGPDGSMCDCFDIGF
jgi:hypothetical protein